MATYYINADTGDDTTGDGSQGNPWLTFSTAFNNLALSGDTIFCQNSTNAFAFVSDTINKNFTLKGESVDGVVFDALGDRPTWSSDGKNYTQYFLNIHFKNAGTTVAYGSYGGIFKLGNANFTNCIFSNLTFNDRAGISQALSDNTLTQTFNFTSCLFYGVRSTSTSTGRAGFLMGGNNGRATEHYHTNCTMYFFEEDFLNSLVGNDNAPKYLYMKNCILYSELSTEIDMEGKNLTDGTMDYCCYYGDFINPITGSNNINADPLLIDPDNQNFNLSPSSPCIDAGTLI